MGETIWGFRKPVSTARIEPPQRKGEYYQVGVWLKGQRAGTLVMDSEEEAEAFMRLVMEPVGSTYNKGAEGIDLAFERHREPDDWLVYKNRRFTKQALVEHIKGR